MSKFERLRQVKYQLMTREQLIDEIIRLKTIVSNGWKGKDELIFERHDDIWYVTEHRKSKSNGKILEYVHEIKKEHIDYLWDIIKLDTKIINGKTSYRDLVPHIIRHYGLPITLDEFNGGVNRAKYYFLLYYYPIKVLEMLGNVKYGGRGTIVRLKK